MVVNELMTTNVSFVKEQALIRDVVNLMRQYDIGCVPVCNDLGELVGITTDRDLLTRALYKQDTDVLSQPVADIMTKEVHTITPDVDIHTAALAFSKHAIHRLPVLQRNRLVGILSISDLAKKKIYLAEVGCIIGAITHEKYTKK